MGRDPASDAIRWFDSDAEAYAKRNPNPSEHLGTFLDALPSRARVLDIGCGPGADARALHDLGHAVVAMDAAPAMIAVARARHPGLDFRVADVRDVVFPDASFDGVLALFSLIFVPKADLPNVLLRVRNVLAPGGALLAAFQGGASADVGEAALFSVMTRDEVEERLRRAGFRIEEVYERRPHAHEMPFRKIHALARRE